MVARVYSSVNLINLFKIILFHYLGPVLSNPFIIGFNMHEKTKTKQVFKSRDLVVIFYLRYFFNNCQVTLHLLVVAIRNTFQEFLCDFSGENYILITKMSKGLCKLRVFFIFSVKNYFLDKFSI